MKKRPSIDKVRSAVRGVLISSNYKTLSDTEHSLNIYKLAFPGGVVACDSEREGGVLYDPRVVPDDGSHIDNMLEKAKTDPLYFDAACARGSIEILRANNIRKKFRLFLSQVLVGAVKRPRGSAGRRSLKQLQDQFLAALVTRVVKLGFSPTRNEVSDHRDSACDIVADAMVKARLQPARYESIKDIWEKRNKI